MALFILLFTLFALLRHPALLRPTRHRHPPVQVRLRFFESSAQAPQIASSFVVGDV